MLITFANNFYEICSKMGVDYTNIKNAAVLRDNIVDKYLDCNDSVEDLEGMLALKDTKAMVNLSKI